MIDLGFVLNGSPVEIEIEDGETLLSVIRGKLNLTGTKMGCGVGECGACTVLIDQVPVDSCIYLAAWVEGKEVTTIEGIGPDDHISNIQKAFIQEGAVQCGFCTPGMVLSATALLQKIKEPTREEIKANLAGNMCRCAAYKQILDAVEKAAEMNTKA